MKSYNQFSENIDKVAALKQKQKDAVAKHKESGTTPLSGTRADHHEHDADVGAQQKSAARSAAKERAAKRAAIAADVKSEIQRDSKQDK